MNAQTLTAIMACISRSSNFLVVIFLHDFSHITIQFNSTGTRRMQNFQTSIGGVVDMTEIDVDCYKIGPLGWIYFLYILVLLLILGLLISQPASRFELKWFLAAIVSVVLVGLLKMLIKANYLITLIADRRGLYFPSRIAESYYLIPWAQVLTIEKVSFPLNSRGLRVGVDCDCFNAAVSEVGNVVKEQGRCFIYTIPQLRNRDKVINDLDNIRYSTCEANPADDIELSPVSLE